MREDNLDNQVNQLVDMLDSFMDGGGGHMNVTSENPNSTDDIYIETYKTAFCSNGTACSVENMEHDSIDNE